MESEPFLLFGKTILFSIQFYPLSLAAIVGIVSILLLLFMSALISGSEAAFFSLSPSEIKRMEEGSDKKGKIVLNLLDKPEKLLASILIANNFVNVAIIVISAFVTNSLVDFSQAKLIGFIFQVILITALLLLFGEIMPKILATSRPLPFSKLMAFPMLVINGFFAPLSFLLTKTAFVGKRISARQKRISIDDLSQALEITSGHQPEEKKLLKGIATFGHTHVSEIMKPRLDVVALDIYTSFNKLKATVVESGYSRIPIFDESFDNIKGVLYVKDLLPHIDQDEDYAWQNLLRKPYFVPESKKISGLLSEFQSNRIHMAIVVDEYGGTCGIVSLEDILEEIVGEISDESDDEAMLYTKIDDNTYMFEAKILLNDFCKVLNLDDTIFDSVRGEAETLAGLILEITGQIPAKNDTINHGSFRFNIDSVDNKRIKRVKVTAGGQ